MRKKGGILVIGSRYLLPWDDCATIHPEVAILTMSHFFQSDPFRSYPHCWYRACTNCLDAAGSD